MYKGTEPCIAHVPGGRVLDQTDSFAKNVLKCLPRPCHNEANNIIMVGGLVADA